MVLVSGSSLPRNSATAALSRPFVRNVAFRASQERPLLYSADVARPTAAAPGQCFHSACAAPAKSRGTTRTQRPVAAFSGGKGSRLQSTLKGSVCLLCCLAVWQEGPCCWRQCWRRRVPRTTGPARLWAGWRDRGAAGGAQAGWGAALPPAAPRPALGAGHTAAPRPRPDRCFPTASRAFSLSPARPHMSRLAQERWPGFPALEAAVRLQVNVTFLKYPTWQGGIIGHKRPWYPGQAWN